MRYFLSDCHFRHWNDKVNFGIINFERNQFQTIEEHDEYLVQMIQKLCEQLNEKDEVWNLGDFGSLDFLFISNLIRETGAKSYFVYGNHDRQKDLAKFEKYFDKVYFYPVFLSQKLVVSHFPVAVYPDTINIHGHTHGADLKSINHVCASIHIINYKPITQRDLDKIYQKMPKFNRRFLYEPWADEYHFTQPREDVIMDYNSNIDLSASRVLHYMNHKNILK